MASGSTASEADLQLSDKDFSRIAQLVHGLAGIVLAEAKRPLVHSRLIKRLRALNLRDFAAYADYISASGSEAERLELISAVTTNVTSFFREQHHFDMLTSTVLPPLLAKAQSGGRVRLWSAGCSSGDEPFSLAATVLGLCPDVHRHDLRILATDIDRTVIEKTRRATYAPEAASGLAPEVSRRLFVNPKAEDALQVSDNVRKLVQCNHLNLQDKWPFRGPFDVIFCRNVVIYFDKPTQERLWLRFAEALAPGGYLMIGHSERVTGPSLAEFSADGMTAYRRR
ncbi:protein-glutamate O-methyltransferase CheR [Pseudotabrizicola sp.]|uniref:CheR family methyltransferase n=1 Tax=Pseudotabrizicola sp. TaxID=2939647 RepID=UPI00271D7A2E|nr:protein-glutamate O-methyltransferase [Pseudotabrizicola sp.]MDO8881875.1 protein-glutamate O-methyltransferase [Pseudotabrizicola sp.]